MIKSYWLRLLLFAVVGAALGLGISLASPARYEAIMQVMIYQPLGAPMPPTSEAISQVADVYNSGQGRSVSTQVEQLTSWGVITKATRAAAESVGMQAVDEFDPQNVQQSLIVSAEATSDIITLRVRMSKPDYAKTVCQEIYRAFDEQNTENTMALGSQVVGSLENLQKTLKVQLDLKDSQLEALRHEIGPDPTTAMAQEVTDTYKVKDAISGLTIEIAGSNEEIRGIERQIKLRPKNMIAQEGEQINGNLLQMEAGLASQRADREALLDHYLPDHEVIRAKDILIATLESERDNMVKSFKGSITTIPDPIRQTLTGQLAEKRIMSRSLQDRLSGAKTELARREASQQKYPALQTRFQQLLRDIAALERRYTDTESALIGFRGIQRARQSPTQLITAPDAFPEPVSPRHPINLMFGLVGGLILGVLSMLSTEGKRQPIRSLAQLNSLALQPVYRIIPELRMPFRGLNKAPAEPYETLLVNFRRSDKRPYRMGIVGITKDSGASITVLNAALAAEKHGNRAVIVETDPRSTIKRLLSRQGLSVEGILTKVSPNVTLYSVDALRQVQNPDGTSGFGADIRDLETDLTVFDFEPATESAEYAFAASHLDEMVVLVRAEKAKSVEFLHAQQALSESGCPLITVVFTRSSDLQLVTDATVSYDQPKALSQ